MNEFDYRKIFEVMGQVRSWPPEARLALAQSILGTLGPELTPARRRGNFADLIGLLKTDGPPLTDEDVARMRDEAIMEKYGS